MWAEADTEKALLKISYDSEHREKPGVPCYTLIQFRDPTDCSINAAKETIKEIVKIPFDVINYKKIPTGKFTGRYHCNIVVHLQCKICEKYYHPDFVDRSNNTVKCFDCKTAINFIDDVLLNAGVSNRAIK